MICPRCGYMRVPYDIKRSKKQARTNFKAKCPKCKLHYDTQTNEEVKEKKK